MSNRPATVRSRGLGAELRDLRRRTGLNTRDVAKRLGWSLTTLSRTENGLRPTGAEEVAALLVLYDIKGRDRDRLLTLAREAEQPGWWEIPGRGLASQLKALVSFESEATRITNLELTLVPGLLQIPDYTRAVMKAAGVRPAEIEGRVAVRLGRQAVLTRPEPPEFVVILDEAVLRRCVGGRAVMAAQLNHLVDESSRSNVTVQVLPYDCGAHWGMASPFVLYEFDKARSVVHLEPKRSSILLEDLPDVAAFSSGADILRRQAITPAESVEYIAAVAAGYEG
jgi:transcriptional regulator with XRE-family HTH domain